MNSLSRLKKASHKQQLTPPKVQHLHETSTSNTSSGSGLLKFVEFSPLDATATFTATAPTTTTLGTLSRLKESQKKTTAGTSMVNGLWTMPPGIPTLWETSETSTDSGLTMLRHPQKKTKISLSRTSSSLKKLLQLSWAFLESTTSKLVLTVPAHVCGTAMTMPAAHRLKSLMFLGMYLSTACTFKTVDYLAELEFTLTSTPTTTAKLATVSELTAWKATSAMCSTANSSSPTTTLEELTDSTLS